MKNKNILISFSGGRTSAFMAKAINESEFYKDWNKLFIFANTGKENEETLEFIRDVELHFNIPVIWIEAIINPEKGKGVKYKVVNYETANRDGQPFEDVIKKHGLPSKKYRHCTRDLKEGPIHKYAKKHFGTTKYLTAIGIRADEKHRVGSNAHLIYPLVDMKVTEKFIRKWWDKQKFDLKLKDYQGNCDMCFLKSIRKKLTLLNEDLSKGYWWDELEKKYKTEKQPMFDVYRDITVEQLMEASTDKFKKAVDKHEADLQNSLFDFDMDIEYDCFCKVG